MVITLYSYDRQTFFHREKSLALAMEFILPLRIRELLKRDYGREVCLCTVGRIISSLLKKGKIKPVSFYYGHTRQKKARKFHGHAQRLKKA